MELTPSSSGVERVALDTDLSGVPILDDGRFYVDEMDLDDMLNSGSPLDATEIEARLLEEVRTTPHVTSALAHTTLKAIAVAQVGRQLYDTSSDQEDTSYKNLGMLLSKSLASKSTLYRMDQEDAFNEATFITGCISEMTIYALAAYNNTMSQPLSGVLNGTPRPRYILPSTRSEDRGRNIYRKKRLKKRTGYDFKITYLEGEEPERLVQVKTSKSSNAYIPSIIVVPVREIAIEPKRARALPHAVAQDAMGLRNEQTKNQIKVASRRLNSMIR